MLVPNEILLAVMVACVTYSIWVFFFAVPEDLRCLFRYQMWRLRDDAFDAARRGDLSESEEKTLIFSTEKAIAHTKDFTVYRILAFCVWPMLSVAMNWRKVKAGNTAAAASPAASPVATALNMRMFKIGMKHLLTGSPSGWLALIVLVIFVAPVVMIAIFVAGARGRMISQLRSAFGALGPIFMNAFLSSAPQPSSRDVSLNAG
jgi:nitrate reductase NapE component